MLIQSKQGNIPLRYTEHVILRLDKPLKKLLKRHAKKEKKTSSALIREMILALGEKDTRYNPFRRSEN